MGNDEIDSPMLLMMMDVRNGIYYRLLGSVAYMFEGLIRKMFLVKKYKWN